MAWGIFEVRDEYELLVCFHVAPMVKIMGYVTVMRGKHRTSADCECQPRVDYHADHDVPLYMHNDTEPLELLEPA